MTRKKCSFKSRAIYEDLRRKILDGALPPNSKLPPAVELAAQYGVAKMTLRSAMVQLVQEGLLSSRPYHGTWVCDPAAPSQSRAIGVIVPVSWSNLLHPVFSRLINGIEGIVTAEGYTLTLELSAPENPLLEKALHERLESREVAGWIIPSVVSAATRKLLGSLRPPAILLHFAMPEVSGHLFLIDRQKEQADLFQHTIEQGYRRPCLVYPSLWDKSDLLSSFEQFAKEHGLENEYRTSLFQDDLFGRELGIKAARSTLNSRVRPDLFICDDDDVAFGVMHVFAEMGLEAPEIGIIGAGNFPASALVDPPLTTVSLPYYQLGREVTRLLIDLLNDQKVEETVRTFAVEILPRASSRRQEVLIQSVDNAS